MLGEFEDEYVEYEPVCFPLDEFEKVKMDDATLYDLIKEMEAQQELDNRIKDFTEGMTTEDLFSLKNSLLCKDEAFCNYFNTLSDADDSEEDDFQKVYK